MQANTRLREIDFLRGIAIILVIFRHQLLFDFLKTIGWIGVDLFFVLSGFLVSGLLFKEYKKFGNIKPKLFLIRRGFKIYPIFYLTYILYIAPKIYLHKLDFKSVILDLTFLQNYFLGWGYAYSASWSLAVEEHFYFGLALLLWLLFNKNLIKIKLDSATISSFEIFLITILVLVNCFRLISNIFMPENQVFLFTVSHLRIDSLLFGVLISYWFYFKYEKLSVVYHHNKKVLLFSSFLLLSFSPFIEPLHSFFVKTIGFTMLYIAFGILLIHFLVVKEINSQIDKLFTRSIVTFISRIGFCSYSIYIIHCFIIYWVSFLYIKNTYITFFIVAITSIFLGFFMTFKIEKFFLSYRDKFYPSRIN